MRYEIQAQAHALQQLQGEAMHAAHERDAAWAEVCRVREVLDAAASVHGSPQQHHGHAAAAPYEQHSIYYAAPAGLAFAAPPEQLHHQQQASGSGDGAGFVVDSCMVPKTLSHIPDQSSGELHHAPWWPPPPEQEASGQLPAAHRRQPGGRREQPSGKGSLSGGAPAGMRGTALAARGQREADGRAAGGK
jgi:hypothetical protein